MAVLADTPHMQKKSRPSLKVSAFINPSRIVVFNNPTDKKSVIEILAGKIAAEHKNLNGAELVSRIMQREAGISTTLDTGLSIPHARIEDIEDIYAAVALVPAGMPDSFHPGLMVKVVFLFISPADPKFFQKHLQLLSSLSSMFQPEFVEKLLQLSSPEQVFETISSHK